MKITDKWRKGTLIGSVVTGFAASLCCVGPIILAFLGIGSITLLTFFATYQPIFITIALIALGGAFYFTYRKKKPDEDCEEDEYCARPGASRLNQIILWIATVWVLIFIFSPQILSLLS